MGTPIVVPNPPVQGQIQALLRQDIAQHTWMSAAGERWFLQGAMTPWEPNPGVRLVSLKGVSAAITHKDQQGAHQDGKDWIGANYENCELDMVLAISGRTVTERRRMVRHWIQGWRSRDLGRYTVTTRDMGEWWLDLRTLGEIRDVMPPDHAKHWEITWSARSDAAFWQSHPSEDYRIATNPTTLVDPDRDPGPPMFVVLTNIGTVDAWPEYLLQGPGIFVLGDNGPHQRFISIELFAGELVKITTDPRRRKVVELNSNKNLYPRLVGRFSQPVAAATSTPTTVAVPLYLRSGVAGVTSVRARLVPQREWPE